MDGTRGEHPRRRLNDGRDAEMRSDEIDGTIHDTFHDIARYLFTGHDIFTCLRPPYIYLSPSQSKRQISIYIYLSSGKRKEVEALEWD